MSTREPHDAYAAYATIYDDIPRDKHGTTRFIRDVIEQHRPRAKHILELGCGTGDILAGLGDVYHVTGIDSSPALLTHAKRKLPGHTVYAADISDFHLGQKFDVIYCLGDSLNRLPTFAKWEAVFDCVRSQLKSGGVFVLEYITPKRLESLVANGLTLQPARENYAFTKLTPHPTVPRRYQLELRVFLQKDPFSFTHHPATVDIGSFPPEDVQSTLARYFDLFENEIPQRNLPGRIQLIGRKRPA